MSHYVRPEILENLKQTWNVGDLCTCEYGGNGGGIVYEVTNVDRHDPENLQLTLFPVIGMFTSLKSRRTRGLSAGWCRKVTKEELQNQRDKLNQFVFEKINNGL